MRGSAKALLVLAALNTHACAISSEGPEPIARGDDFGNSLVFDIPAEVVVVRDGDTIEVEVEGEYFVIRVLGIDTPELYGEDGPEAYAQAAHSFTLARAANLVGLEFDDLSCAPPSPDGSCFDIYDRLLAYLRSQDGSDLGAELLRRGLARVYRTSCGRQAYYDTLQAHAQEQELGMWSE